MKKETFETLFENDKDLLSQYVSVGSLIKCNGDLLKAKDEAEKAADLLVELYAIAKCETSFENIVDRLPPNCEYFYIADWTPSQIVSFAAGRKVEVVETDSLSNEGFELRNFKGVWSIFEDGYAIYIDETLKGRKCTRVLRILPA